MTQKTYTLVIYFNGIQKELTGLTPEQLSSFTSWMNDKKRSKDLVFNSANGTSSGIVKHNVQFYDYFETPSQTTSTLSCIGTTPSQFVAE